MSEAVRNSPVARACPAQGEDKDVAAEVKEDCEITLLVSSRKSQGARKQAECNYPQSIWPLPYLLKIAWSANDSGVP